MNKANKAAFSKTSLKKLTDPLDLTDQPCSSLVIDGGWLLYMVKWEQGQTWQEIADSYLRYVEYLGRRSQEITVVFYGYSSSPKDHDHIRRTKNSCCNLQVRPDMIHLTPREKFMDNTCNKSELIHLLSSTFLKHQIIVEQCDNDADTSIVRAALAAAIDNSVEVSINYMPQKSITWQSVCTVQDVLFISCSFSGEGRRCRCADNAGAPLLKHHSSTFPNYVEGLLRCQEDP